MIVDTCIQGKYKMDKLQLKIQDMKTTKVKGFDNEYDKLYKDIKENLPLEFYDFIHAIAFGCIKYADGKFDDSRLLDPTAPGLSLKDTHASMFRHLAASAVGIRRDKESQLDHALHLACRAIMCYYRLKKGVKHIDDIHEET